ncbi:MAG TPA: hypothetical protein RMH99_01925 [Sandaracinaceae bacterium LLY-WYZ-13_1]|nr:hypothetical protein [Sandaracinaceae bacterium LLY-WYZ-13_1]
MPEPPRRRKGPLIAAVVATVLIGIPLAAWLLRGTIATSMARDELAARGLTCDERFEVAVAPFFDEATVGPTRCSREGGILRAVELLGPATIALDGLEPGSVRAESLRLVLRDTEVRGGSRWAQALRRLNLEQRVAGLVKGISELSALPLPPTTVGHVDVVRDGDTVANASGLTLTPGSVLQLAADRIAFTAGPMGVGRLELTEVTGTSTRARVHLEGRATARAGVGILGSVSTGGHFELDAEGLDTGAPRFRLSGF